MKMIKNVKHYNIGEVAQIVDRSYQNIYMLCKYAEENKIDLIPKPVMVGNVRYWSETLIDEIRQAVNNLPEGYTKDISYVQNNTYMKMKNEIKELKKEIKKLKESI